MVEFANRLVARGHRVTFYLPEGAEMSCTWMRCDAQVKPIKAGFGDELDVVLFNHEPQWHLLDRFERARRRVFYALHDGQLYNKEGSWESCAFPWICSSPTATGPPTRSSHRRATARPCSWVV